MTNDTSTEAGCMQEAVDKLEANLATMGVTASYSRVDGYYALLDEILNISTGILVDSSVTIIPDKYSVQQNETVTVTGVLSAIYDGTVDMTGFLEGASVKIYDGSTLVDTVTTDSTGAFTKTFSLSTFGSHSLKAVFDGVTGAFDDCESSAVVVYCTNTVITLNVPMSLIYSDAFNLTGVLKDTSDNTLSGKTVSLLVGGTCVDTDTTDNNGEFSFTQTPVHMGTHSFQISWEGDVTYYPTVSSIVTREIGKETSVLNVSSPTTNQNVYSDGSLSVEGTLQSNDAEAIAGASVLVKQDGTTLTTLTTDSNGAFTGSVNASNLDTGNLDIIFESNSTHTASSASIAIVVNDPTLTLVSDKSILSYVDHDVATLTATYTGANPSGKVVSFDIVDENGDVIENIDSATTDSNGECSVSYLSNHAGDLYIRAQCGILLSEIYSIVDYIKYDENEHTVTFGSSEIFTDMYNGFSFDASNDFELSIDFYQQSSNGSCGLNPLNQGTTVKYHLVYGQQSNSTILYWGDANGTEQADRHTGGDIFGQYITLKFVKESNTITVYKNGTLFATNSNNEVGKHGNMSVGCTAWGGNKTFKVKNLKLKAL